MKSVPDKRKTQLTFLIITMLFIYLDPFFWILDSINHLGGSEVRQFFIYKFITIALIAILLVRLPKLLGKSVFQWRGVSWKIVLLWIILFILTYQGSMIVYGWQPTQHGQYIGSSIYDLIRTGLAYLSIANTIIVAPIIEELIFRAGLMSIAFRHSKYGLDIFLSASLFSVAHMIGFSLHWTDFLFYGLPGLLLAIIYRTGKSIWYSILAHSLWNLLASWEFIQYLLSR